VVAVRADDGHGDGGGVLGVATVLVEDTAPDGVGAGVVEGEALRRSIRCPDVGGGQAATAGRIAVVEAGGRVGAGWVERVAEADGDGAGRVDRPVVAQRGRRGHVV